MGKLFSIDSADLRQLFPGAVVDNISSDMVEHINTAINNDYDEVFSLLVLNYTLNELENQSEVNYGEY